MGEKLIPVLTMKGVPEWRRWLEACANAEGSSSSGVVDEALAMWAKRKGHPPPPDRTGKPVASN